MCLYVLGLLCVSGVVYIKFSVGLVPCKTGSLFQAWEWTALFVISFSYKILLFESQTLTKHYRQYRKDILLCVHKYFQCYWQPENHGSWRKRTICESAQHVSDEDGRSRRLPTAAKRSGPSRCCFPISAQSQAAAWSNGNRKRYFAVPSRLSSWFVKKCYTAFAKLFNCVAVQESCIVAAEVDSMPSKKILHWANICLTEHEYFLLR